MTSDNFQVVRHPFTMREAIDEAKRCLHCKVPLCEKGCPIGNHIKEFNYQLSKGNLGAAMETINEVSNLPAICGRVCPHEKQCQGHCVLARKGNPVQIGRIESFIADFDTQMRLTREPVPQKTRGRIAVIGSGPAGLTVAGDLARKGFAVTIYEGQPEPGGVLMWGIPEYRLPKDVVRSEILKIAELGVNFVNNTLVGTNGITVDKLFAEGYDAISPAPHHDIYSIGAIGREMVPIQAGERVGVIGGGNVAMDAARTAIRMGCDVTVIYRRGQEEMPAIQAEYEEAVKEGVKFWWHSTITEFLDNGEGRLGSVRIKSDDRERTENFDRIFLAIGSRPANRIVSTTEGIDVDEKGYVKVVERPSGMTTRRGVFAGGDVVHRPQTVVLAMKAAKDVALGIEQYVDAVKLLEDIEKANR